MPRGKLLRNREAVEAGQLDVEQDDVGLENRDSLDGLASVDGLTYDLETLRLEQGAGRRSEALMVIDDEHGPTHNLIVRQAITANTGAGTNTCRGTWAASSPSCRSSLTRLA